MLQGRFPGNGRMGQRVAMAPRLQGSGGGGGVSGFDECVWVSLNG